MGTQCYGYFFNRRFQQLATSSDYQLKKLQNGIWEKHLPEYAMAHNATLQTLVEWEGRSGERIPAWAQRVVQDSQTKIFSAQVWNPFQPYVFKNLHFKPQRDPLLIYECHIGMSSSEEKIASYDEFRTKCSSSYCCSRLQCHSDYGYSEHPITVRLVIMFPVFLRHLRVLGPRKNLTID
jgi:1,4-alpha-glucan branching enzyme